MPLHENQLGGLESAFREAGEAAQADIIKLFKTSAKPLVLTMLETDAAPSSVPEGYLKLHLLSHRLSKPHTINLDGLFGILPNVAWTSDGAIDIQELPAAQLQARIDGFSA